MKKLIRSFAIISTSIILSAGSIFSTAKASEKNAFDFSFKSIDGKNMPLSSYKGKLIMVVNTASLCGFTKQYSELQELYSKYKDKGFVIIGVPSNDFGGQEPEDEKAIKKFCEINYNITFPMTEKYSVKGENAHPFYKWAEEEKGGLAAPKWNFHKYLISPEGEIIDWFFSSTSPTSGKVIKAVEENLPKK